MLKINITCEMSVNCVESKESEMKRGENDNEYETFLL